MAKLLRCAAVLIVASTISFPALAAETDELAALDEKVTELYQAGKSAEALPLAERALANREKALGPDDIAVVVSLNNLAGLYQTEGRYTDAEQLYKRALEIRKRTLSASEPAVAQSMNNLAALYQIEGRYREAEVLYRNVLAIAESSFGRTHPAVATTENNLAAIIERQGRLEEAERRYLEALAIREKIDANAPAVATTMNNLAGLYQKQGRLPDAERLYIRALEIREKALGREHPDVGQSLNNLATLYQIQGRYTDAEPLFKRALTLYENSLGFDRTEVAWSVNNLANLYEDQGRLSEAEQLRKRAPAGREPTKPDQPATSTQLPSPDAERGVISFLFASTRREVVGMIPANPLSYSGERGPLSFGSASVRVPPDRDGHRIGHIERPSSWSLSGITLSFTPNENEQFVIRQVVPLSKPEIDQFIEKKGAKTALVFVHGFNTTFEGALYRNAQIANDLQYSGLSVLFTWASRGSVSSYIYDMQSAYLARDAFITLLEKLENEHGIEQVNVLAHSMGSLIVLDALANYARSSSSKQLKIARLVMAAPDVDLNQFQALAPLAMTIAGGMTIYVSSADRALVASRKLAGGVPRAGDVPADGPIIVPNVETIDVTAVGEDIFGLNHSVFATSRDVLNDIGALLRLNLPAPRLVTIRPVPDPPAAAQYWRFVR